MSRKDDGQLNLIPLDSAQAEPAPATKSPAVPAHSTNAADAVVMKRDGTTEPFSKGRIVVAIESAFKAVRNIPADEPMTGDLSDTVNGLAEKISQGLLDYAAQGASLDIERIQDSVENQLMCDGFLTEARRYILYREDRRKIREQKAHAPQQSQPPDAPMPADDKVGAHLLLKVIYSEAIPQASPTTDFAVLHQRGFSYAIQDAVHNNQLAPELLMFDLDQLASALKLDRDELIAREGLEWLYGNCLARDCDRCIETPQYYWMRLAMAFASDADTEKEARALEYYEILSTLRFLPSEQFLRTGGCSAAVVARANVNEGDVQTTSNVAGHVNIAAHIQNGAFDELLLYATISSAVRLLDDAVDLANYRSTSVAQHAVQHRDIGLGIVAHENALAKLSLSNDSPAAADFVDRAMEAVAYYGTLASTTLAAERGSYENYGDSQWSVGALPFESLKISEAGGSKDWLAVRAAIRQYGMRNGRILALTPAHAVEKLVGKSTPAPAFIAQLQHLIRCRKWTDGPVWITIPEYLTGPDLEQAYLLAQQLGIRPFSLPVRVTLSDQPFVDAAAATKVFKSIEKSS